MAVEVEETRVRSFAPPLMLSITGAWKTLKIDAIGDQAFSFLRVPWIFSRIQKRTTRDLLEVAVTLTREPQPTLASTGSLILRH